MSKREYKLAAAFFLILGLGVITFAINKFIDERALRSEHSTSLWTFGIGLLGILAATAIRIGAQRQLKNGR
jgi:hypothetical protein